MKKDRSRQRGPVFYLLLVVLAGVWGYVIYQVTRGAEDYAGAGEVQAAASPYAPASPALRRDRQAGYEDDFRDPFAFHPLLWEAPPVDTTIAASPAEAPPPPPLQPPPLTLHGTFDGTALLHDAGQGTHLVAAGDSVYGAHVVAVYADSIAVRYFGTSFTLRLRP